MVQNGNGTNGDRLSGWKEIAAHFGKDERTVKRWERSRGMPVRRLPGPSGTTVYASTSELDAWLSSSTTAADPGAAEPPSRPATPPLFRALVAVAAVLLLAVVGAAAWFQLGPKPPGLATVAASAYAPKGKAADLVLEGTYYWSRRTPDDLNRALQIFTNAIAEDPDYAPAYLGLANCYNLLREFTLMPAEEAYPKARAAAERAIALDPGLPEAHASLAFGQFYWFWDSASALASIERALALDPDSVQTRHWHATMLMYTGAFDAALAEITRAQALDPQSRAILADKGLILYYAGKNDEAFSLLKQLAESETDFYSPAIYLAILYLHEKRYDDHFRFARAAAKLIVDEDGLTLADAMAAAYASGGEAAMFEAQLAHQRARYEAGKLEAYWLARTHAYAGNAAEALRLIATSIDRHEQSALILCIDPAFRSLHDNPQFRALVARTGMPPLT